LIISCALLGFGIGGTVLSLFRTWFEQRLGPIFRWGTVAFALSMPVCFRLGELLPLSVYFPPVNVIPVLGGWLLFWGIHGIPFVLAGILIGVALMAGGKRVNRIYAVNLIGSAAGALGSMVLLKWLPATGLAVPFALVVLASGFFLGTVPERRFGRLYLAALITASSAFVTIFLAGTDTLFPLNIDEYKPLAYVQRLARQGSAHRALTLHGPRGRVDLFIGPHFHTLLSLSSRHPPPPMDVLLRDGFQIGSILSLSDPKEARFLDGTLSAVPYKLIVPKTVLILGDSSGIYVWLARLSSASSIVLVQPDPNVLRVLETHPSQVLRDPRVRVVVAEPRAFLDASSETFDIIHLSALEGFAAGSGGIGGLREDYLATVEGFRKCLHALTAAGMALVIRGVQEPERDNLKIAATWIEAMERQNIADPGACIMVMRDELSAAILAGRSPFSPEVVERFKQTCRSMSWDPEWFPAVREEDTNRVHVLPGPPGSKTSWYHRAMEELLSTGRESFYRDWMCNIRPATDDRPFFHDFFRWASVSKLREIFGPLWPTRSEMGFLLLLMAALWTALTALVFLPAPVLLLRRGKRAVPISQLPKCPPNIRTRRPEQIASLVL